MANGTIQFFLPHHKTVAFILWRLQEPFSESSISAGSKSTWRRRFHSTMRVKRLSTSWYDTAMSLPIWS